ncbi:MAG: ribonuclease J [bacterium]
MRSTYTELPDSQVEPSSTLTLNPDALRFIPLGGIGEIGKNMFAYEYGGEIIVIDAGLLFPEQEMLGIDLVIPDITYLLENADKVHGILLTHGHEDHIGALPWVLNELNVPVWGTKLTLGLLRNKLSEHTYLKKTTLNLIDPDQEPLVLGPFTITFFRVTHSIPDAVGMIIDTPAGRIVHSGDFKIDQTPLSGQRTEVGKLASAACPRMLALMVDVTNVEKPGWVTTERVVADSFDEIFADAEGRIIIATFASNISRMQEILNVAHAYDRRVCVMGRSMVGNMEIARDLGFVKLPSPDILVEPKDLTKLDDDEIVVLTTGSQGEPLSALRLMSAGEHKFIKIRQGDLVVMSATPIPGNEDLVYRTINQLFRQGAEVIYQGKIHVSGHGNQEELKMMLTLTCPRFTVPMHGEFRHMVAYRKLAGTMGYPADRVMLMHSGDVLELTCQSAKIIGKVQAGRVMIDGLGVGDIGTAVIRDRLHLSEDGMFIAVVNVNEQTGEIIGEPEIVTRGFIFAAESEELLDDAKKVIRDAVSKIRMNGATDIDIVKTSVRSALNKFVFERTKRRPMVIPVINEL